MPEKWYDLKATLELFEERFTRLQASPFYKILESEGKGAEISLDPGNPFPPRFRGPREKDSVEFITLLRSFLPLDETELVCLSRLRVLYRSSDLPTEIRQDFETTYQELDRFHTGHTPIRLRSGPISRKKLFSVFAYGSLIHTSDTQRSVYEAWKRDETLFAFIESAFVNLLIYYLDFLGRFYLLNGRALAILRSEAK